MIGKEIVYERNLTGSYMRVAVSPKSSFDEKIMLKRKLKGALPVERCFVDGIGQYWYNITGKQSLDMYCGVRAIGIDFIERMVISICNEIEILELNLIDTNCLMLAPEFIFVTNENAELIFTVYPGSQSKLSDEFMKLMEYMLTRIDHKDAEAVKASYSLYEKIVDEDYSIVDIRKTILNQKEKHMLEEKSVHETKPMQSTKPTRVINQGREDKHRQADIELDNYGDTWDNQNSEQDIKRKIYKILEEKIDSSITAKVKKYIKGFKKREKKEDIWISAGVEDFNKDIDFLPQNNPTVCLANYRSMPKGMLLYEGGNNLENIQIEHDIVRIGKAYQADCMIEHETVSNYHAKIEKKEDDYYIEDLNSLNGTIVNGESLSYKEKRKLQINDIVQFADVRYRFI